MSDLQLPLPGDTIAVWFSCGAASAIAAAETLRLWRGVCNVRIVNNPVAEEDADNLRFMQDVSAWLGCEIEQATNTDYPDASAVTVWDSRKFMSAPHGAPCTQELKKRARQQWEERNPVDWHVLGFTADEEKRLRMFRLSERPNTLGVLVDAGLTKADCFARLRAAGVPLPLVYERGYPNANCIGCVKATSPTYWNLVRQQDPEVFNARARQSRRIGAKLARYKGRRIFLDELPPDAQGRPLKNFDVECGVFCEEKPFDDKRGSAPAEDFDWETVL